MGADEEATHERLKAHLGQLVDPKIQEHRGRMRRERKRAEGDITFEFVADSSLEGDGFEPSVPQQIRSRFREQQFRLP